MKKILLIATGGTIASKHTKNGLKPFILADMILEYVKDVKKICEVTTIQIFNIDSTNMEPKHWSLIVQTIKQQYSKYDGFVIAHGTDTLAYTAAALSYMIQNSNKPIVITGAQKPIDLEITDAKTNLLDSFLYVTDEQSRGVTIVFGGKVIAGTRAKKVRTKSYNAFDSINYPYLAMIQDGKIMHYIESTPFKEPVAFYETLNNNIFLIKLIPGLSKKEWEYFFNEYDCIILESFGVGGLPSYIADTFYELHKKYKDTVVIMATQVSHEGSDMSVYEVGNKLKEKAFVLESYDMTLEAVIAKAMWMLAKDELTYDKLESYFYKKINYDMIYKIY